MDYQTLSIVLTGIGMMIALTYYALQIRNQNRTRQAQLYMGLFDTMRSPDFRRQWHIAESLKWKDWDEFIEKYTPEKTPEALTALNTVLEYFEGVGVLLKRKLFDINLIEDLLANSIVMAWEKYEPLIMGSREYFHRPTMWDDFERLYKEIKEREKHPELKA